MNRPTYTYAPVTDATVPGYPVAHLLDRHRRAHRCTVKTAAYYDRECIGLDGTPEHWRDRPGAVAALTDAARIRQLIATLLDLDRAGYRYAVRVTDR